MGFIPVTPQAQEALVIAQENKVFADALAKGQITQAQYDAAMKAQRARLTDQTVPEGGVKLTAWTRQYQSSQAYYQSIGYSQYGGLYPVPDLPTGAKVTSVKQTSSGSLEFEYTVPQETAKSQEALQPSPSRSGAVTPATDKFPAYVGTIPPAERFQWENLTATEKEQVKQQAVKTAVSFAAPVAFVVAPQTALIGAGLSAGLGQGISLVTTGKPLSVEETALAAGGGAAFSVIGGAVMSGVGAIPKIGQPIVSSAIGRIGVNTALGAGTGYVLSGGDLNRTVEAAAFGAALGTAFEGVRYVGTRFIQPRASQYLTQKYLETGKLTAWDKAVMRITGVQSPVKDYILQTEVGQPTTPFDDDARLFAQQRQIKNIGGKSSQQVDVTKPYVIKSESTGDWASATKWQKPTGRTDTINKLGEYAASSSQKQVLLLKQQPAFEIAAQKPVAITVVKPVVQTAVAKATPAIIVGLNAKAAVMPETKSANPFTQFQGKPYYRKAIAESIEYAYYSYPQNARSEAILKGTPTIKQIQQPWQLPTLAISPIQGAIQTPIQGAIQTPIEIQTQETKQTQRQTQTLDQQLDQLTKQLQNPFGSKVSSSAVGDWPILKRNYLASVKRKYPIYTPSQLLFGV
jgi:hypothetical protein